MEEIRTLNANQGQVLFARKVSRDSVFFFLQGLHDLTILSTSLKRLLRRKFETMLR